MSHLSYFRLVGIGLDRYASWLLEARNPANMAFRFNSLSFFSHDKSIRSIYMSSLGIVCMEYVSEPDPPCISAVQMLIWPISEQGIYEHAAVRNGRKGIYSN